MWGSRLSGSRSGVLLTLALKPALQTADLLFGIEGSLLQGFKTTVGLATGQAADKLASGQNEERLVGVDVHPVGWRLLRLHRLGVEVNILGDQAVCSGISGSSMSGRSPHTTPHL